MHDHVMKSSTSRDNLVSVSVRVHRDLFEQFKALADSEDRTIAGKLRRIMREHVEDEHAAILTSERRAT